MPETPPEDDANGVEGGVAGDSLWWSPDEIFEGDAGYDGDPVEAWGPLSAESRAVMLASETELRLEVAVDELKAADAAVARAAAERLRMVDHVRDLSLTADALQSAAIDAERAERRTGASPHTDPTRSLRALRSIDVSERSARAEIAAALRISEGAASALARAAELMRRRHPRVFAAMQVGEIRERHATVLVRSIEELPHDAAERVIAAALPLADRTSPSFVVLVNRLVAREHPTSPEERHARAAEDRAVWVSDDRDGMSILSQLLPSVEAHAILNRAKSMAKLLKKNPNETRTTAQLVADVLRDLQLDGGTTSLPVELRGSRPTVFVTVPALAIATGNNDFGTTEVDGVGPIDLETATQLIGRATEWTRIVTHPVTGLVLCVDRQRYRPPAAIARIARWAYGTCTFPGCRAAAQRCELDHIVDWNHGGTTCLANLHPLCTSHHTVKHATRWRVKANSGGGVTWTSPGGQRITTPPKAPWRTSANDSRSVALAVDPPPF